MSLSTKVNQEKKKRERENECGLVCTGSKVIFILSRDKICFVLHRAKWLQPRGQLSQLLLHSTLSTLHWLLRAVGSIFCGIHNKSTQKQFTVTNTLTKNLVQQQQVNRSEQLVLRLPVFPSEAVQIVYSRPQSHTSILCIHLKNFLRERSLPKTFAFLSQGPFKITTPSFREHHAYQSSTSLIHHHCKFNMTNTNALLLFASCHLQMTWYCPSVLKWRVATANIHTRNTGSVLWL